MERRARDINRIIITILKVYTVADNIVSPLGTDTAGNYRALSVGQSGISLLAKNDIFPEGFYGAYLDKKTIDLKEEYNSNYTPLERMFILSIKDVLQGLGMINKEKLLLIISTTKGNIELLGKEQDRLNNLPPSGLAKKINDYFEFPHDPLVVSNACISGVSALLMGKRLINMGMYDHVLVAGGDTLSEFTVSGFQCLKAIATEPCKPYDAERNGISLGEACGTVLLSKDPTLNSQKESLSIVRGGGQSNDANHISGPSRTGKGLKIAVRNALRSAKLEKEAIGYINAHGTATSFNDEMEAIAFSDLGLSNIPLNSLKGYFGHTLGAAGVIESIISVRQLNEGELLKSIGFERSGVSREINILKENIRVDNIDFALKTASGFGGCNAAIIFEKDETSHISI